jgi:AcrR family transcriptional regulator
LKSMEIKEAALKFFSIHGYEGASLSQIAEEVGIKKQSIYAHFKGKDDLFLQVLRDAKETELSSKLTYFSSTHQEAPEQSLYGYLRLVIDLFQKNEQLKFWLRMSFFPPAHLAADITEEVIELEDQVQVVIEKRFGEWVEKGLITNNDPSILALAFIGVVDSILLELVYVNEEKRLNKKLEASWSIFWRGISSQK